MILSIEKKKKNYGPFSWMRFNCLMRTTFDFEETVYFLQLSSQKLLVLIFCQPLQSEGQTMQILISDPKKGVSVGAKI